MKSTQKKLSKQDVPELVNTFNLQCIKTSQSLQLSKRSTFNIGGQCLLAVFPKSKKELISALNTVEEQSIKFDVIGNGSNILFPDGGYDGVMIFTSQMKQFCINPDGRISAASGSNLTVISKESAKRGLAGLEFACGIPGSCGGAVYMNAGAYGGEIADIIEYSEYYDINKKRLITLTKNEHCFSYRHSVYSDNSNRIITEVGFKLSPGISSAIKAKMDENMAKRRLSQPHEFPNAGSIFKRPEGFFAAKLIDDCGLKGLSIGGAQVSEKHAGFIVNKGGATAADVLALISEIKRRVLDRFGVELECEIKIIS